MIIEMKSTFTLALAITYDETYINKKKYSLIAINEPYNRKDTENILNDILHGDLIQLINSENITIETYATNNKSPIKIINDYIKKCYNIDMFVDISKYDLEYMN